MKNWVKKKSKNEIPRLRRKMTEVFNEFIRLRDKKYPCISCGIRRVSHAGHYFPTSTDSNPALRYCEMNVHGQCVTCNSFQEGNRHGYRQGLIKRYGVKVLYELDIKRSVKQNPWGRFEYKAMIEHYRNKVSELKEPQ